MGGSYGGYMVMAGLTDYPELFAVGANLFGVVNFKTFFEHTEPWMAAISKVEYGNPETEAELLHRLSPIHKVDRVTAPTIVLHGANATNVPVVEAEQVVESLKKRGVLGRRCTGFSQKELIAEKEAPNMSLVHYALAKVYRENGERTEAIKSVHRSIEIDPQFADAHYLLAQLYQETDQPDLARQQMELFQKFKREEPQF